MTPLRRVMPAEGRCPTGEHSRTSPACGFVGCVDLRPWARAHRYRTRFEESSRAERAPHVRGDGRWYVELPCRYGTIYPFGGTMLCAAVSRGVTQRVARLPGVQPHQRSDREQVVRFPLDALEAVAAILRPKRRPGRAVPTPEQRESLQRHAFRRGQARPERARVGQGDQTGAYV